MKRALLAVCLLCLMACDRAGDKEGVSVSRPVDAAVDTTIKNGPPPESIDLRLSAQEPDLRLPTPKLILQRPTEEKPATAAPVGAAEVIELVQKSESIYPGVTTSKAIAGLLSIMESQGRFVDIVGWTQNYRSGGTHDVWLEVRVNDEPSKFHWVVTPDGVLNPANKLAQNVTKRQVAKK